MANALEKVLEHKAARRKELARLPFSEKLVIVKRLNSLAKAKNDGRVQTGPKVSKQMFDEIEAANLPKKKD